MKLHLPVVLRKALLACFSTALAFSMSSGSSFAEDLSLGSSDSLIIDYADSTSIPSLNNGELHLEGDTVLSLLNAGQGDGKTYTLLTGVAGLVDAEGNAITLDSSNNAISKYFDISQSGDGFWANGTLQLVDGKLQMVLHRGDVITSTTTDGVTRFTSRQTGNRNYQYYKGINFVNISSYNDGGSIYGGSNSSVTLSNNGSVEFRNNRASTYDGGAIFGGNYSRITLSNNGSVAFYENRSYYGGAIYGDSDSSITLSNNASVEFCGNYTTSHSGKGGAICSGYKGTLTLSNNGNVVFSGNSSSHYGGAIYGDSSSTVSLRNNGSVSFCGNSADYYGGAIYGDSNSNITLSNNGSVVFSGNSSRYGSAIYGDSNSRITLSNNGSVVFSGNSSLYSGAIYGYGSVTLSNNGSVEFSGNSSDEGGAIYGRSNITLSNNGRLTFIGNSANSTYYSNGGAIRISGNLSIQNNGAVLFSKNAEIENGTYRLRSICAGGSGAVISLSAAEKNSIEFHDSIYISGSTMKLNADYTDDYGVVHKQTGDIIFTGAYTETHLNELLTDAGAGRVATEEEILNSRTNEVQAVTNLYGGRLRVEDGAIFSGRGIIVHEGSGATVRVKDVVLKHSGYDLTFNAGTTLELAGSNSISGNVLMKDGSGLSFDGSETIGKSILQGNLSFVNSANIVLSENTDWSGQNEVLLYVAGDITGFAADSLTISGGNGNNVDLRCIDGTFLVLNYNADTFNPYCMGDMTLTSRQISPAGYKYFNNLTFENISSSNSGGAIYERSGHSIVLRDNQAVTFSRNVSSGASYFGGAIYTSGSLSIKNNGSVLFEKNAEIKNGTYRLRSIYAGGSGDVISFSAAENKGIEFRDSVYIGSGSTVNLNADYTDASGVVHKQTGDIIFTGAYTETHLNELLTDAGAGRVATEEEILNSRTNEVQAVTNLYGGRLRVEDGAIYSSRGIIVHEGSGATVRVKDAVLNQCGYDLTFNSGSTLELAGANSISGNVFMQEDSWLSFDGSESMGVSSLLGDLTFVDGVNISLNGYDALNVQNEILMRVQGSLSGWDATTLTILNGESDSTADLRWIDGIWLVLNYNEETFNPSCNGEMIVQSRQYSPAEFKLYNSIAFENISSYSSGSAIYEDQGGGIVLSKNNTVTFRWNKVLSYSSVMCGGAICADYGGSIVLNENNTVTFIGNTVSSNLVSRGGAIYGNNVGLCCNESVIFQDNCALATGFDSNAQGGAIYGNDIELNDNGSVIFCGNTALSDSQYHIPGHAIASGGALYATGDLNIRNNDSALFEKNVEITDGTYRLRSIYAEGSWNVISLSASDGKSIEFRDSIYIGDGATVELNADYTDASGVVHKQAGDIIFTGAYAETHLNELLSDANAGRVATSTEINNSRMSEVWTVTNLYGGRLCVENGACYQGCGITAVEGSNSTVRVKDAVLQHSGYDLTFSAGTTLELAGTNRISGNVLMKEDSWLAFDGSESMGLTILLGDMSFEGGANISLSGYSDLSEQNKILLYVIGSLSGCDADSLSISGGEGNTADVSWIDGGMMVLNYNAETFNPYYMGDISYTSPQKNQQSYFFYESVAFENISGRAIEGSAVMLCGNGEVSFEVNGIYAYDAAPYGGGLSSIGGGAIDGVDIVLSGNSSVIFRDNEINISAYLEYPNDNKWERYFSGGAIYGNGVVELSGNDNVIISGNEASSSFYTYHTYVDVLVESEGGGIFADDRSSISSNEKVSFSNNHAKVDVDVASRLFYYYTQQAYARGGALSSFDVVLFDNGDIEYCENSASAKLYGSDYYGDDVPVDSEGASGYAQGGAIYGNNIDLQGNESVTVLNNAVSAVGGNAYARGGAIYGNNIAINDNGSVTFGENIASSQASYYAEALGGAIYGSGNLSIQNNDSVLFEKNAEITNGTYRLRSIYAYGSLSLSAAEGKSIEFRDSIYVYSGNSLKLNADYTDADGVVHKQTGDIIFTGAYTETHLNDLLEDAGAGRVATAGEILNSLTSEVYAMTNLYGGRLRVEDGAIYQGYGITAMEGSNATVRVKDATLSLSGYDLTFHDGTLLEIDGVSTVNGNVELLSGSTLNLLANSTLNMGVESCLNAENGANIALGTDATLNLEGAFEAGDAVILELSDGAAVSRGVTTICNNGGKDVVQLDAVAFASGSMQKVKDAHVVVDSSEDTSITYQLENASVENRGSGKLTMAHENNSISSVSSAGGDVEILNVDSSDKGNILKLVSLELHESASFGAYIGDTVSSESEACVQVSGSAVFGVGTTVNADLVLMDGCSLTMDDTVRMGSDLSINGTHTLDGDLLSLIQNAEIGMHFDLFTGIDDLYLNGVLFDSIALTDNMSASTYFIGLEDVSESERYYRLSYASETPGEGVLSVHVVSIPEPTTATLGILALAGLAARRRRRW